MLNRWIEADLLDVLGKHNVGCIAFTALAQGLLTDKYLDGRAGGQPRRQRRLPVEGHAQRGEPGEGARTQRHRRQRGQSLAQMAIAWTLRDPRVTSTVIGASSVGQLEQNVAAVENLDFTSDELTEINRYATDSEVNLLGGTQHSLNRRKLGSRHG